MPVDLSDSQPDGAAESTVDNEIPTKNKEWFDQELAPKLLEIAKICEDKGISFIATVEFRVKGRTLSRVSTQALAQFRSMGVNFIQLCNVCGDDIDKFLTLSARMLNELRIDYSKTMLHKLFRSEHASRIIHL